MKELQEYKALLETCLSEINSFEQRNTKAATARIRKLSNQIGKDGVLLRAALVAADKKGYLVSTKQKTLCLVDTCTL